MAILRSQDGKFYDVDDSSLQGKEVAPENVPNLTPGGTMPPSSGGASLGGGIIQIYVSSPGAAAQGPDLGPPQAGAEGEEAAGDVQGHDWCRPSWQNCWQNWHNWHNWNNWNNSWHNHHRG
ncbi:MAG: hypothetical protein IT576_12735 [Verrucomicrobiales bacterium]|nr:hypothetical protein [Verrucomicrobiales bacterium]